MEQNQSSRWDSAKYLRNCARDGILADFTVRARAGQKAKLTSVALARILIDAALDPSIAPKGIRLKGVRIAGNLELGPSSRIEEFPAFEIEDSDFDGFIDMSAGRFCWLSLQRCTIAGGDRNGERVGIDGVGITVRIDLIINRCVVEGPIDIERAEVGGALAIECTRCASTDIAISMTGTKIGAHLRLSRLRTVGGILAGYMTVGSVLLFDQVIVRGLGGSILSEQGIDIRGSRIAGDLSVTRSRIEGSLNCRNVAVEGYISLTRLWIDGRDLDVGLQLAQARCAMLAMENATILGGGSLFGIEVAAAVILAECTFDTLQWEKAIAEKYELACGQEFSSLTIQSCNVGGSISIHNTLLDGGLSLKASRIGENLEIIDTQLSSPSSNPSIVIDGAEIAGATMLYACSISSGVRGIRASIGGALEIAGCGIGPINNDPSPMSMLMTGTKVGEVRLTYSIQRPSGVARSNHIRGALWLARMVIQESIDINSTSIKIDSFRKDIVDHSAVVLDGSRIGRHVNLADQLHTFSHSLKELSPLSTVGAVSLDDCTIDGDVYFVNTKIHARTAPLLENEITDSFDMRERKIGVAVSMRGARIAGTLRVSQPDLRGIIDLRGASIGLLSDGVGRDWGGHNRGSLKLDGFIYGGLDDASLVGNAPEKLASGWRVSRRLQWLAMQYPNGRPTPPSFSPQPYEQLASTFGNEGNERERRAVVIAKRDAYRKVGSLTMADRALASALSFLSRYGYSPARSVNAVLALIAFGVAGAVCLDHYHALAFKDPSIGVPQAIPYAVDMALPVIDFAGASDIRVIASRLPAPFQNQAMIELLVGAYQMLGVTLVSIAILTLTGALREKD